MVRLRSPAPYFMGEFPSGQRGQTVNLLSLTSLVRIQLPPPNKNRVLAARFFVWWGCLFGTGTQSVRWFAFTPQSDVSLLNGVKTHNLRHRRIPSFHITDLASVFFYNQAKPCLKARFQARPAPIAPWRIWQRQIR